MASRDEAGAPDTAHQAGASPRDQSPSAQGNGSPGLPPPRFPSDSANKQFRLKLTMFWGVVIAAIVAAFTTGYPSWENYIVQEAAKRQLRAYIDVRPQGMSAIEEGLVPRVHDSFHNIGRTPAYDNGSFSRILVREYPLTRTLVNDECRYVAPDPKAGKWFIGTPKRPGIARDSPLTAAEVGAIKGGNSAIYFHGRVCYRDIFNEPHRTDFCLYWKWDAGRISPSLSCPQGNSAG
jgi:hypothetical protein